jgi:hypothetical protein
VWTFDSDAQDLRATHTTEDIDLTPENWGHHVIAFSRGQFAITQRIRRRARGCTARTACAGIA